MVLRQAPAMAWKFLLHALKNVKKPTISKNAIKLVTEAGNKLVTLPNTAFSKNYFLRIISGIFRSPGSKNVIRSSTLIATHRRQFSQYQSSSVGRFSNFMKVVKRRENFINESIKNLFETNARYNPHLNQFSYGNCLSFYTVGEYIHKGCDGAVYELKRNEDTEYDLAVKKLFNYHSQRRSSRQLWEENKLEIIPLVELPSDVNFNNNINKVRRIPKKHANIIDIKTAFVDDIPYLKDSHVHFPEAQRFYEDYDGVVHNVRTIFIVMKRYKMDFAEYNRLFRVRSPRCNTILYGQLIESLCFLHSCTISHRDIKLDNILIEFENEKDVPFLVLADFGYSLSTGDWNVYHRRNVSLGGNFPFRAPEIACSKAGPNVTVNFEKADSWSAGALGYDFFGCAQPFVGSKDKVALLSNRTYKMCELPKIGHDKISKSVEDIIFDLLERDPNKRIVPYLAGNVILFSLFADENLLKKILVEIDIKKIVGARSVMSKEAFCLAVLEKVNALLEFISAQTILSRGIYSKAELQLRATILSRLCHFEMIEAFEYFNKKCF